MSATPGAQPRKGKCTQCGKTVVVEAPPAPTGDERGLDLLDYLAKQPPRADEPDSPIQMPAWVRQKLEEEAAEHPMATRLPAPANDKTNPAPAVSPKKSPAGAPPEPPYFASLEEVASGLCMFGYFVALLAGLAGSACVLVGIARGGSLPMLAAGVGVILGSVFLAALSRLQTDFALLVIDVARSLRALRYRDAPPA
jgi:hypothetical protein